MSVEVTLRLFSGTPDPVWTLPSQDAQRIQAWIAATSPPVISANKPAESAPPFEPTGYLGFYVSDQTHAIADTRFVPAGTLFPPDLHGPERVDEFLFKSIPSTVQTTLGLDPGILTERALQPIQGMPEMSRVLTCGSTFYQAERSRWNQRNAIRNNRCYGYAANVFLENAVALPPGRNHHWTEDELLAASNRDAFQPRGKQSLAACPAAGGHWVAACLGGDEPYVDFHFFRLDSDGTWSHKPGDRRSRKVDDLGNPIGDLSRAQFHEPYVFCGFLSVGDDVRDALCRRLRRIEGRCPDGDCRAPDCDDSRHPFSLTASFRKLIGFLKLG